MKEYTYTPEPFNVDDITKARGIILTNKNSRIGGVVTTDMRWEVETAYFMDIIEQYSPLHEDSVVLDYGCGIGRMAKAIIDKYHCRVVGIDIAPNMRKMAVDYVNSEEFMVASPAMWHSLKGEYDLVLGLWVFLHCLKPQRDLDLIYETMKPRSKLIVANDIHRAVPTTEGVWINDFIDIKDMLKKKFSTYKTSFLDTKYPGVTSNEEALENTFWGVYEK